MQSDQAMINILKDQVNTYKMLLELLKQERQSLVNINFEEIEKISKEKDTIVMKLRLLEEERQRLTKEFAAEHNIEGDVNLEVIGKLTGNSMFPALRSQLLSLLQSIEEMNKFNSILIDRSIQYVNSSVNFFNSFISDKLTQTTGILFSKET